MTPHCHPPSGSADLCLHQDEQKPRALLMVTATCSGPHHQASSQHHQAPMPLALVGMLRRESRPHWKIWTDCQWSHQPSLKVCAQTLPVGARARSWVRWIRGDLADLAHPTPARNSHACPRYLAKTSGSFRESEPQCVLKILKMHLPRAHARALGLVGCLLIYPDECCKSDPDPRTHARDIHPNPPPP
jgi:hypothetical protein